MRVLLLIMLTATLAAQNQAPICPTCRGLVTDDLPADAMRAFPLTSGTLCWNVTTQQMTAVTGACPLLSAPGALPGTSAAFLKTDTLTQGNWKSIYGSDGFALAGDSTSYPSYARVLFTGQSTYVWAASPTDPRAPQRSAIAGRVAAAWFAPAFSVDIMFSDTKLHQLAAYAFDWDTNARAETIDVLDAASGLVLDSRPLSSFSGGSYLIWNVSGHITVRLTRTSGSNAVLGALFFDPAK